MSIAAEEIRRILRLNVDDSACVQPLDAKLSAYFASAYDLFEAKVLGSNLTLAFPVDPGFNPAGSVKGMIKLGESLGADVTACFASLSRSQRRELIKQGRAFITVEGDFYLPQLSLSLVKKDSAPIEVRRPFNPAQQLVFLYCLYSDSKSISQVDVQEKTGLSSGSVSLALSLFVELGLLDFSVGGKTGRKKSYLANDQVAFYRDGIGSFGSPVKETVIAPASVVQGSWPKSGLSALAENSDLLPPPEPFYAISPIQANGLSAAQDNSPERCVLHVLRYNPSVFAKNGCIDPLTMLLTVGDEDERISIALQQALGGYAWYRG